MRAGKLDRSIVIQSNSYIIDPHGSPVYTWTDIATVRAEIIEATSQEFIRNYGATDEAIRIFRIRYITGLTNDHRVLFEGVVHDIKAITEIQRRRGIEIRTLSTGDAP